MHGQHDPDAFFEAIHRRYSDFQAQARRLEGEGQGEHWPVIHYYTPAGERVRVAQVMRNAGSDVLEFQGEDQLGNPCDVIATTISAQVVIKLRPPPVPEPERRPVGFNVRDETL